MDAAADLAVILADAAALGLAEAATYTPPDGTPLDLTVTCQEIPQPDLDDIGGRRRRRQLLVLLMGDDVDTPVPDAHLDISTGNYAGAWVVIRPEGRDVAGRLVTVREDERVAARVAGVERDPNA